MPATPDRIQKRELVRKLFAQTNGTSSADVFTDIELPEVETWGPYVQSITAYTLLEQRSANFQFRIVFYSSYDGVNWSGPTNLFENSNATAPSGVVQADFTDKAKLGCHIRFAVCCSTTNNATTRESGVVSITLCFDFRT